MKSTTTTEHVCKYCSRSYKLQENYRKHVVTCEFFHNINTLSHDDFRDSIETLPTYRELYGLVKTLAVKCSSMEAEIKQLKNNMNIRQKKQVLEYLNSSEYGERPHFIQWIEEGITVTEKQLKKVFDTNLIEGIKEWISDKIGDEPQNNNIPILAFSQKPGQFYIVDDSRQWKLMSSEFNKMLNVIGSAYMREFVRWRKEHESEFNGSEEAQERDIQNMMKINGYKISTEKRNQEVRKWLYGKIVREINPQATAVVEF